MEKALKAFGAFCNALTCFIRQGDEQLPQNWGIKPEELPGIATGDCSDFIRRFLAQIRDPLQNPAQARRFVASSPVFLVELVRRVGFLHDVIQRKTADQLMQACGPAVGYRAAETHQKAHLNKTVGLLFTAGKTMQYSP